MASRSFQLFIFGVVAIFGTNAISAEFPKTRLGNVYAHQVTLDQALGAILAQIESGQSGYVVTPNLDHLVKAAKIPAFRDAYHGAFLSLVDGQSLVALAKLARNPLPQKISGSDLVGPLMEMADHQKIPVFLMGGPTGLADRTRDKLVKDLPGLKIVGTAAPPIGFENDPAINSALIQEINDSGAKILLVGLGAPKQELWMAANSSKLKGVVSFGLGGVYNFVTGDVKRAPEWVSQNGMEWLYRISQDPKRLIGRYAEDMLYSPVIVAKTLLGQKCSVFDKLF